MVALSATITTEFTTLRFHVDPEEWVGKFDRIEVHRSLDTGSGPYEEITSATIEAAAAPYPGEPAAIPGKKYILFGKTLSVKVGTTNIDITFTGDPVITAAVAASQVRAVGLGMLDSGVLPDGQLFLKTVAAGDSAFIQVTGSDASSALGIPSGMYRGKNARLPLVFGKEQYLFEDRYRPASTCYYKTRFFNTQTLSYSSFSDVLTSANAASVPVSDLVACYVDLMTVEGKPLQNREVLIWHVATGDSLGSYTLASRPLCKRTDSLGHVEFSFIRGAHVTVGITGTGIVRDVVIPTDPMITRISLLDSTIGSDDVFRVRVPVIEYGARRSF